MKLYLEAYPYRDSMVSPPSPHEYLATDIVTKLDGIKTNDSLTDAYDVFTNIVGEIQKLRDYNTIFTPPCFEEVYYEFPFDIRMEIYEESGEKKVRMKTVSSYYPDITEYYKKLKGEDYVEMNDKIITNMKIGEGDKKEPLEAMIDWEEGDLGNLKTSGQRLNEAIYYSFVERRTQFHKAPEPVTLFYNEDVEGTITEKSVVIDYIIYDFNEGKLMDLCKKRTANNENRDKMKNKNNKKITPREERFIEINNEYKEDNADEEFETIVDGKGLLGGYYKDLKAGFLFVNFTETLTEAESLTFADNVLKTIVETSKKEGVKGLMIDIQGVAGSQTNMGSALLNILYPYQYPLLGRLDMPYNDISKLFIDDDILDYYDNTIKIDLSKEENRKNVTEGNRNREWTKYFTRDEGFSKIREHLKENKDYGKEYFKPEEILVIVEGTSGASTGIFGKHLSEEQLGKFVIRGFKRANEAKIKYDITGFNSWKTITSDEIQEKAEAAYAGKEKPATIPEKFTHEGAWLGYSLINLHSWKEATKDESLEYKIQEPDFIFEEYPLLDELFGEKVDRIPVGRRVAKYLDEHATWEIELDDKCEGKKEHMTIGHPYDPATGKFDTTKCVDGRCELGYYKNGEGKCVISPYYTEPKPDPPKPDDSAFSTKIMTSVLLMIINTLIYLMY